MYLKKILPYKIIKLKNDIQKLKNINSDIRINSFVNNKKDNCYLRAILKKNLMNFLKIYKNKKILITGHTGFKGSWLSIWLNYLGAKKVC